MMDAGQQLQKEKDKEINVKNQKERNLEGWAKTACPFQAKRMIYISVKVERRNEFLWNPIAG